MTVKEKWKKPFVCALLSLIAIGLLAGCSKLEEDIEVDSNTLKTELVNEILRLDDSLSEEELQEEDAETLKKQLIDLKVKNKRELDNDKMELHNHRQDDDPNPPNPPIYEKPKPVPNPPTEKE